ncbi:hypothetical protein LTR81_002739 [Elasticomyces elasticus]
MATTANPPPGPLPTNGDPFNGPGAGNLRYASYDTDYTTNSPSHAKRALEAHLKDTDLRIQNASKLGTTLLQQRKELSARLEDVQKVQNDGEVPADLKKKLVELEKEYNEIGKESARAFLPKSNATPGATPAVLSGQAGTSPTKVSAPQSRRQRNQAGGRVHDIEFATEISTSLLAQVRSLQAALAEKDDALHEATSARERLENEVAGLGGRLKQMSDHEQRYKDDNWNLEMKVQELEGELRETVDKHDKVHQSLKSVETEKTGAQRELDELRVAHDSLAEEHEGVKRAQEGDLHSLRRDLNTHLSEKTALHQKVQELTAQNTELARAVSSRWNQNPDTTAEDTNMAALSDREAGNVTPDELQDMSPVKGTPARHGMLESETLKSSLNHAHRMIQNLKNNIHREKTEKIELKRLLQDAREELEARRGETGIGGAGLKKRRSEQEKSGFKKPMLPRGLGASRSSTTEILEDEPDWEEDGGAEATPTRSRFPAGAGARGVAGFAGEDGFDHAAFGAGDTTDTGFETARERDMSTTEPESAFQTSNEAFPGEDSDDLTETEGGVGRSGTVRAARAGSPMFSTRAAKRRSLQSTASTSASEGEDEVDGVDGMQVRTPVQMAGPKYRLRLNRGARKSGRVSDIKDASPSLVSLNSPASSTGTPQPAGQSLGDELDALDDGSSVGGTPSRLSMVDPDGSMEFASPEGTATERGMYVGPETPAGKAVVGSEEREPEISSPVVSPEHSKPQGESAEQAYQANVAMLAHEYAVRKSRMVDAGVMTEPWVPEAQPVSVVADGKVDEAMVNGAKVEEKPTLRERAGDLVGGALGGTLAGFGLARLGRGKEEDEVKGHDEQVLPGAEHPEPDVVAEEHSVAERAMNDEPPPMSDELPAALTGVAPVAVDDKESAAMPLSAMDGLVPTQEPKSLTQAVSEPLHAAKEHESVYAAAAAAPVVVLQHSDIVSQETAPIALPKQLTNDVQHTAESSLPLAAASSAVTAPTIQTPPVERNFDFSTIDAQHFEPLASPDLPPTPLLPKRSSRRIDMLYDDEEPTSDDMQPRTDGIPGTEAARAGAGFFASMAAPPLQRKRSRSMPTAKSPREDKELIEPKVFGGVREGSSGIPTLVFGSDDDSEHDTSVPLSALPNRVHPAERDLSTESVIPVTKPLQIKKPMADEGSQTMVSGGEIDDMLRNKSRTSSMASGTSSAGVVAIPPGMLAGPGQRQSIDSMTGSDPLGRGPRRPPSAGSIRSNKGVRIPPPLPEDYTEKIVAAAQKGPATPGPATAGTMGPPVMPASAYKQSRAPKTPGDRAQYERTMSKDGTTPRPVRHRDSRTAMGGGSGVSRRTSVSSFASELDERFNITRGDLQYQGGDIMPSTDPRMIQAITQTMIGEYLWKYTRKAGRSETSNTRHRRFFWIHPYTRTLYWSEQDPSTAGRNMLKAKIMAIQSVRVITDDNTYPPGLHRKSIVVVTPGREIVFTAPTGQRHETWFNALSYLLLRTEQEKQEATDTMNDDDLAEFNPGFSLRRSISRIAGRNGSQSRASLSSYNSQATRRTSSPRKREAAGSLAQRQSRAALRTKNSNTPNAPPALVTEGTAEASRTDTMRSRASVSDRFNSLASRFRTSGSQRGSFSTQRGRSSMSMRSRTGDPSDIYDASVISDSAEDLRTVIERQEKDADRLENVRACCDGKHDVGSISRHGKGRHSSLTSRFGSHSHSHAHPPRAEPIKESQRPRRGE